MALDTQLEITIKVDTKGFDSIISKSKSTGTALDASGKKGAKSYDKLGTSLTRVSKQLTSIGSQMALKVTAPILLAGAAVLKFSGDFETGMLNVRARDVRYDRSKNSRLKVSTIERTGGV